MDVLLPEFSQTKIMSTKADVKIVKTKDKPSYDLIIGIETLAKWRAKFDFIDRIVTLDGESVPMKPLNAFSDPRRLYNMIIPRSNRTGCYKSSYGTGVSVLRS
jgi:hypothetical protein